MIAVAWAVLAGGCTPHMSYEKLHHEADQAVLDGRSLYVTGSITPYVAPPNYGVKLMEAHDDTGRSLALRSFSFSFAKGLWFYLELSEPDLAAKNVFVDVCFAGGGVQRAKWTLPIIRDPRQMPFFVGRWWEERHGDDLAPGG